MKYLYFTGFLFTLASCTDNTSKVPVQTPATPEDTPRAYSPEPQVQNLPGNYVSRDYAERAKGYDWVSVNIQTINTEEISIRIRSRADKKKPTCTLDARAGKSAEGVYQTPLDKGAVVYTFKGQALTISAAPGTPEGALNFYCSGGASIAGTYTRIEGTPDTVQVDKTAVR